MSFDQYRETCEVCWFGHKSRLIKCQIPTEIKLRTISYFVDLVYILYEF
jgi:hypothetical protein